MTMTDRLHENALPDLVMEMRHRIVIGGGIGDIREPELDLLVSNRSSTYRLLETHYRDALALLSGAAPRWRPIRECPIKPYSPAHRSSRQRFIVQNERNYVSEAYCSYVVLRGEPVLRWYSSSYGRLMPEPVYFMMLPEPHTVPVTEPVTDHTKE